MSTWRNTQAQIQEGDAAEATISSPFGPWPLSVLASWSFMLSVHRWPPALVPPCHLHVDTGYFATHLKSPTFPESFALGLQCRLLTTLPFQSLQVVYLCCLLADLSKTFRLTCIFWGQISHSTALMKLIHSDFCRGLSPIDMRMKFPLMVIRVNYVDILTEK